MNQLNYIIGDVLLSTNCMGVQISSHKLDDCANMV